MPGHSKRKPNPNPSRPPKTEAAYKDMDLVDRICDRIRVGVPYGSAGMCEGLSRDAVSIWIHRAKIQGAKAHKSLQEAVSRIARARGEAEAKAASAALSDPKNAPEFWLERQMRSEFGKTQVIQLEEVSADAAVASALSKLLEGEEEDE